MGKTNELNFIKVGAVAVFLMAISSFIFFALFNVLSSADPRSQTTQFLGDVATKQGLAATVAWMNTWLGLLTVPVYIGLYFGLRRSSESYMLLALVAGLAWGIVLVIATPLIFTLLVQVAPAWADSSDTVTRNELVNIGTTLGWIINTTIGGTVFFLRAVSVLAISRVSLLQGGRLWTGLGWFGIIFAVEHIITGVLRVLVVGSGGAAGSTLLGAAGGVMFFVWLVGIGVGLWRLRQEAETSAVDDSQRLSQTTLMPAEHIG